MQRVIASITCRGFCAEAALSRNTSGLPRTVCARIGKSARMRSTSSPAATASVSIHHAASFTCRSHQPATAASSAPRAAGSDTPSTASGRKASTSMARASASGMPRVRR